MIRQIGRTLGVTIAFTVGAVLTALVLDLQPVQSYLGLAAHNAADWYRAGFSFFGVAALAGLVVDAFRFAAVRWGDGAPAAHRTR